MQKRPSFFCPLIQKKIDILYEDNHLFAIHKPAGVLSQPDFSGKTSIPDSVKRFLKERDQKPGNVFLGIVQRLDREVGGALLFCKTSKAASRISRQIRNREVRKNYRAVLEGKIPFEGKLTGKLKKEKSTSFVSEAPDAKESSLDFRVLEKSEQASLVEIHLITGRHHQIRVQFAHEGFPVWGDRKYGAHRLYQKDAIALCAFELEFSHPISSERISLSVMNSPEANALSKLSFFS